MVSARISDIAPGAGVNVRFVSSSTYWAFVYLPSPEGSWQFLRVSPDGIEPVATFAGPELTDATVAVRLDGDELIAVVDGTELGRVSDAREADESRVGIGTAEVGVGQVGFDSFRVTTETD